ncbi:amidohydrolase family protein [Escherichia coli]
MIIDAHTHIGDFVKIRISEDVFLASLDKYNIDFALCSCGSAVEVDHDQNPIPDEDQVTQHDNNERMLRLVRQHSKRIGAFMWIKPRLESCDQDFEDMIASNRDIIYGIKVHPYHSKMAFNSDKVQEYIRLAQKYDLPVVSHTSNDYESSPQLVYEMAHKYPDVNFVMCHMGLATDNQEAIELIAKLPNLYGDTAWVRADMVYQAIKICGSDKILFGTDNPINGLDTYNDDDFYNKYFAELKSKLTQSEFEQLMFTNAKKLFKIKI